MYAGKWETTVFLEKKFFKIKNIDKFCFNNLCWFWEKNNECLLFISQGFQTIVFIFIFRTFRLMCPPLVELGSLYETSNHVLYLIQSVACIFKFAFCIYCILVPTLNSLYIYIYIYIYERCLWTVLENRWRKNNRSFTNRR